MPDKWLVVNLIPDPLPPDWGNANVWISCRANGTDVGGKLHLVDQSTIPPSPVSWSTFTGNPTNPDWVPTYDGPAIGGAPGAAMNFAITINQHPYKWAGYATCVWIPMGQSGHWKVNGLNYDPGAYPQ